MLVDTNLLVYASFRNAPEHERARGWLLEQLARPDASLALCWPVVYAFVRLATSPRVFGGARAAPARGVGGCRAHLDQPAVRLVAPGRGHRAIATDLAATSRLRSDDVPDIELASLAIEHGLVLATHDAGFRRFAGVRVFDPLG